MAYRLVVFLVLTFFISTYSYSQSIEKINVNDKLVYLTPTTDMLEIGRAHV